MWEVSVIEKAPVMGSFCKGRSPLTEKSVI
jgi:hypothetical protein